MKAIGIILAGGNNRMMRELSNKRAIAAMPIAGSYRAIDFALSNMTNSRIQKVAVITQYNARSLNEHLSSSKWWESREDYSYLLLQLQQRAVTGTEEQLIHYIRICSS